MSDPVRLGPYLDIVAEDILCRVKKKGGAAHLEISADRAFATVIVTETPPGYEVTSRAGKRPKSPDDIPW